MQAQQPEHGSEQEYVLNAMGPIYQGCLTCNDTFKCLTALSVCQMPLCELVNAEQKQRTLDPEPLRLLNSLLHTNEFSVI